MNSVVVKLIIKIAGLHCNKGQKIFTFFQWKTLPCSCITLLSGCTKMVKRPLCMVLMY